jgi:hypothetical protein
LFDQGVPKPLAKFLVGHEVRRAFEFGWSQKKNGDLLKLAEGADFQMLMTTDQNLRYQQNLRGRKIAVFILGRGNWPDLQPHANKIAERVNATSAAGFHIFEL